MQIQVIKDRLPEYVKEQGKIINYAECKNNELFLDLLISQVGTACTQFCEKPTVESIIEIQLVLEAILKANNISDETYAEVKKALIEAQGEYNNKYIGFFAEEPQNGENSVE